MPDIHFIHVDGGVQGLEAPEGVSLMQVATGAGVRGILADCGGAAQCATCHVYVDEAWAARLPAARDDELQMLDCTAAERRATSRLSCQLRMGAELDGIVLHLPKTQHA